MEAWVDEKFGERNGDLRKKMLARKKERPAALEPCMLKLLLDQDFDHDIIRGLGKRIPELDYTTAYALGLSGAPDPDLLIAARLRCVEYC